MVVVNVAVILLYAFFAAISRRWTACYFPSFPFGRSYVLWRYLEQLTLPLVGFLFLVEEMGILRPMRNVQRSTVAVNLYVGVGSSSFLGSWAKLVITYLVLRQQWSLFDDF